MNSQKKPTTTLLLPTLNEIEAIQVIMPQIKKEWVDEIIIIDGGSTDGTIEWFRERGYTVHSQSKRGFGEGMREGMRIAKGDIVIEFTPDGNSVAEAIPMLINKVNEGYDLVVASRYKDGAKSLDDDWLTGFGNWMFTTIVNIMFLCRLTDVLVGYRAYKKETAMKLNLDAAGLSYPCQASLRFTWMGTKVLEVGVDEPARIGGERKMKPFKTGMELVKIILREFFISLPTRFRRLLSFGT